MKPTTLDNYEMLMYMTCFQPESIRKLFAFEFRAVMSCLFVVAKTITLRQCKQHDHYCTKLKAKSKSAYDSPQHGVVIV